MVTYYGYAKCSTCQKAKKALGQYDVSFKEVDITETPPSKTELKKILKSGEYALKDLFNKSGVQYRELNMKDKLPTLSQDEAIDLLASNGRLVKRPIVIDGAKVTVGFKEDLFKKTWAS